MKEGHNHKDWKYLDDGRYSPNRKAGQLELTDASRAPAPAALATQNCKHCPTTRVTSAVERVSARFTSQSPLSQIVGTKVVSWLKFKLD